MLAHMRSSNRMTDNPQSRADNCIPACFCHLMNLEAGLPYIMYSCLSFLPLLIDLEAYSDRFLIDCVMKQP